MYILTHICNSFCISLNIIDIWSYLINIVTRFLLFISTSGLTRWEDKGMRGVHQPTNAEIFEANNNLQPIATTTLRRRRLTFAGHCYRSFESAPRPIMEVLFFSLKGTRTRVTIGNSSAKRRFWMRRVCKMQCWTGTIGELLHDDRSFILCIYFCNFRHALMMLRGKRYYRYTVYFSLELKLTFLLTNGVFWAWYTQG